MSKHPLAIICALAFVVGGASAFVLEYPPREGVAVQAVTADGVEESEVTDGGDSAAVTDDTGAEPSAPSGVEVGKLSGGRREHASADGRTVEGSRATRNYARNSRASRPSGGQGITGRTVGGVKKTGAGVKKAGAAIGKTFGKVGGVFRN